MPLHMLIYIFAILFNNAEPKRSAMPAVSIPDPHFEQALIQSGYDDKADGQIDVENIRHIVYLDVSNRKISNLKGIEHFASLISLHCENNRLETLDLSALNRLMYLFCSNNRITELHLPESIMALDASCNRIDSLDFSRLKKLTVMSLSGNPLSDNLALPGEMDVEIISSRHCQ